MTQLVWKAISQLPAEKMHKKIYIIGCDTLVESPKIVERLKSSLSNMQAKAEEQNVPIQTNMVKPDLEDTFWVCLLGRGYPAPSSSFRWCTERMKIKPVSAFIQSTVSNHGEVIVALGSRKQESASRAQSIAKHSIKGSELSRHSSLPNAFTYMPIEDWHVDDVWVYLLSAPSPWCGSNEQLFELYKGSNQGECPIVIDKTTPSCGNSRFGCWTCTVVTKDRAIHGLIESGEDWMKPLLAFRDELHFSTLPENKSKYRNYKIRSGRTDFQNGNSKDSYHSIFDKLLTLPEDTLLYPGHDYNGKKVSTIGNEKKFNPRLQVKNVDEYIEIMSNLNLTKPDMMDSNVSRNIQLGIN